jgi:nicotinate-nucleotide pyrophosphorylase (carboxylating)
VNPVPPGPSDLAVALRRDDLLRVVRAALAEDVGAGDVTTDAIVEAGARSGATLLLKEAGVVCGLDAAEAAFLALDPQASFERLAGEGALVPGPTAVARLEAATRAILTGERTALNLVGRLSGIATLTRRYVDAIAGTGAVILDTRKTTPGLRYLEKYAVKMGGGENHRFALWDMYLVKDNHIRAAGGLTAAIDRIQRTRQDVALEVEVESMAQLEEALRPEVDRILVDNRTVEEVRAAVAAVDAWCQIHPPDERIKRKGAKRWPEIEVSGGLNLETVRAYAETGVDFLSVGALTHSAPALNMSLEIEDVGVNA